MGMRAQFVIPVIASILILGGLGLSQQAYALFFIVDEFDQFGGSFASPPPTFPPLLIFSDTGVGPGFLNRDVFLEGVAGPPMSVDLNVTPGLLEIFHSTSNQWLLEIEYSAGGPMDISDIFEYGVQFFDNDDPFAAVSVEIVELSLVSCAPVSIPLGLSSPPVSLFLDELNCPGISGIDLTQVNSVSFLVGSIGGGGIAGVTSIGSISSVTLDGGPVGGTSIPIDTTSLLLAGASLNVWMIPVVMSAAGFGILIARKI